MNICTQNLDCEATTHMRDCPKNRYRSFVAAMAGPSPDEIMARFTSLSSSALRRIADRAEAIITERVNDGAFD